MSPPQTQYNLREILKPYYLEDVEYDESGKIMRSKSPRSLLEKFNPLPSPEVLAKMNFFFLPYSRQMNTSRCMRFDRDERQEFI